MINQSSQIISKIYLRKANLKAMAIQEDLGQVVCAGPSGTLIQREGKSDEGQIVN